MIAISYQSASPHRIARFVTVEAVALLLNIAPEKIFKIDCWRNVVHVVAKGISRFISYGDIPPVLEVDAPTHADLYYWSKRRRTTKQKYVPGFWVEFYKQKFQQTLSFSQLFNWGSLLSTINFMFSTHSLQLLRDCYLQQKTALTVLTANQTLMSMPR